MLSQNVGGFDRILRIVLGAALMSAGFFFLAEITGIIMTGIGFILLITGLTHRCPMYLPCQINTHHKDSGS